MQPLLPPNELARPPALARATYTARVIFKRVGDGRPYPDHGMTPRQWADVPPRQVRLEDLVTTKRTLDLDALLDGDSTFVTCSPI